MGLILLACAALLSGCQHEYPTIQQPPSQAKAADPLAELRRLAEAGDAEAAFQLGLRYDLGHGVPENFGEAMAWYKQAAASDHPTATFNVGVLYDAGRGVASDRAEAARWYRRAADLGFARADYNLGLMYQRGDGVPRDLLKAKRYFHEAERLGAAAASRKLAVLTEAEDPTGEAAFAQAETKILDKGLLGLDREAVTRLRFAAQRGNPLAQYDLGYCYEHGIGLLPARVEAFVWYSRSAHAADTGRHAGVAATRAAAVNAANAVQAQMTVPEQQRAATLLQQASRKPPS